MGKGRNQRERGEEKKVSREEDNIFKCAGMEQVFQDITHVTHDAKHEGKHVPKWSIMYTLLYGVIFPEIKEVCEKSGIPVHEAP